MCVLRLVSIILAEISAHHKCMGDHFFRCHPYIESTTVLSDKDDYNGKMVSLNDVDVYKKLTRDPCPGLERKMNSTLLKLNRNLQIPDPLYN